MKAAIFYFSGTGNTEIIAGHFMRALQERAVKTQLFRMEDILNGKRKADFGEYDLIGLGHPVYGFGASRIAEEFAARIPAGKGTGAFVFKTASSPHYVNYSASNRILLKLDDKGYTVFHNSLLAMPCNFYMKYDDRLNKQLYLTALKKIEVYADEIACGTPRRLEVNIVLEKILKKIADWEEKKAGKAFGRGLRTTEDCTMCLKCVRGCPVSNISGTAEKITFGSNCLLCMRCIYSCPQQAIFPSRLRGSVVKPFNGGIKLAKLMTDHDNDGCFVNDRSRGYYKHFIAYIKEYETIPQAEEEERTQK
ncbi:hypothetical protein C2I18_23610 [Paenibacillus sp. PK3_47]|uniref:EFR1 family ferrodoxin n=1 Tax=Paenibacillus sp. PK3_47 TaxID=2072642 RepID=UPI00201D5005|nr:EFR1 family ferrodoxin [Paenibacillus sp. PK3_47]UQZ36248.1 hypothetical protein C2I18_23610 [Paenibacillus sp. PK3_47]